ncbi:MAG: hypothetical protein KC468_19040, partial [Myxococcales bacterium]|nr:hypothetical protein [Myxococcales bacterium]
LSYVTYPIINTDGDPGSVYLLIRDSETVSFVTEQFGYGDPDRRYLSIADCAVDVAWVEGILEMCENLEPGFACFPELQVTVSDMACDIRTSFSCSP